MFKASWFDIQAKAEKQADVYIYEFIGEDVWGEGLSAKRFIDVLKALGPLEQINLHINSPGGSVYDGNAIYNLLKQHSASVHVIIDGLAASIASVIAMAGDVIEMPKNAMMMIHDPWSISIGEAKDMRKTADRLDRAKETIISSYAAKTGLSRDRISELMTEETWMTADEALELGFTDKVTEEVKIAAQFDMKKLEFNHIPKQFLVNEAVPIGNTNDKGEDLMDLATLKVKHPEIANALIEEGVVKAKTEASAAISAARDEGAKAERERIQSVEDQLIPGHEKLINELKFDGKTTGEQAAVKVLNAERQARTNMQTALNEDIPNPVTQPVNNATPVTPTKALSEDEQLKAKWEASAELQKEFDLDGFIAFSKASAEKRVPA